MKPQDYVATDVVEERGKARISPGNTVRVHQKITEGDKKRSQVFEGVVLARRHGAEPGATFTVRRVGSDGIAVEKIFPLYSPTIDRIETVREAKTRRAKIYFLREKTPRQVREKLRKSMTLSEEPEEKEEEAEKDEGGAEESAPNGEKTESATPNQENKERK